MSLSATELMLKAKAIGKKPATLQLATKRDIADILHLYYQEGWVDYSRDDFEFLFETSPRCNFKLMFEGKLIGVNLGTHLGDGIYHLHSNLISNEYRDKVNYFDEAAKYNEYMKSISRVETLFAAERVVRLYQKGGGFVPLAEYGRVIIDTKNVPAELSHARRAEESDMPAIFEFNKNVYKTERESLIRHFTGVGVACPFVLFADDGSLSGYGLVRKLPKYHVLGPILAKDECAAAEIVAAAARAYAPESLVVEPNIKQFKRVVEGRFEHRWEENFMLKMYRGDSSLLEDSDRVYAAFARYIS